VTGERRHLAHKKPVSLISMILFRNKRRRKKEGKLTDPVPVGKQLFKHRLIDCKYKFIIRNIVFPLIEAGSLIQVGGQALFLSIQAGSLIEAGIGLRANTLPDW